MSNHSISILILLLLLPIWFYILTTNLVFNWIVNGFTINWRKYWKTTFQIGGAVYFTISLLYIIIFLISVIFML